MISDLLSQSIQLFYVKKRSPTHGFGRRLTCMSECLLHSAFHAKVQDDCHNWTAWMHMIALRHPKHVGLPCHVSSHVMFHLTSCTWMSATHEDNCEQKRTTALTDTMFRKDNCKTMSPNSRSSISWDMGHGLIWINVFHVVHAIKE